MIGYIIGGLALALIFTGLLFACLVASSMADADENDAYSQHLRDLEGGR